MEGAPLSARQQDMAAALQSEVSGMDYTSPITTDTIAHSAIIDISEPSIYTEHVNTATKDDLEPKQQENTTTNCVQSIPIPQDQQPIFSHVFR